MNLLLTALISLGGICQAQTFTVKPRQLQVGPNPSAIVAQDLNDDGLMEIVTADRGELGDPREERPANDELSVLIAQAPGEYVKLHPTLKTGFGPYALAIANIDALKWPEIIVANFHDYRNRDLSLFLNLKTESVFKPVEFSVPDTALLYVRHTDGDETPLFMKPGLVALAVADINGDSLRDVLAAGWSSDVLVFFPGHKETFFDSPKFTPAPGGPRDIALADLDGDGFLDAACVMKNTGEVAIFTGNGRGAFKEATRFPTRGRLPTKLKIADMNLDGKQDIVVSHSFTDDSIVIFYGDNKLNFHVSQMLSLGTDRDALEAEIQDIAVGDLNGDGRPDIAAACHTSRKVELFINNSTTSARDQTFVQERYTFEGGAPRALCIGDFDDRPGRDVAVALWGSNSVGFLLRR